MALRPSVVLFSLILVHCSGGGGKQEEPPCTPATCAQLRVDCGTLADGCGGRLECGMCGTPDETCGGTGTPNVCGPGTCEPETCESLDRFCGSVSDGCGALLECGTCDLVGDTCGGGGIAGRCGQGGCTPKTCDELAKQCGSADDGCGAQLDCGSCQSGEACGATGTPGVCGPVCTLCPSSFSCQSGACAGGSLQGLVLDVLAPPIVVVSGRITRNSVPPTLTQCSGSYGFMSVSFQNVVDPRLSTSFDVSCNGQNGTDWSFSGRIYAGTYRVSVGGPDPYRATTNLPRWTTDVSSAFTVGGPMANIVFDVPVPPEVALSGRITRNGVPPTLSGCSPTSSFMSVGFEHLTDSRIKLVGWISCGATGTSDWTFSLPAYPGSYKVTVSEPQQSGVTTNLPPFDTVVSSSFAVAGPTSNVVFDLPVPAQYPVSGRVTLNGSTPSVTSSSCIAGAELMRVVFRHTTDDRLHGQGWVHCSSATASDFTFSTTLYAGTYEVTVEPPSEGLTNLPAWRTDVAPAFVVSGARTGATFNVSAPERYAVSGRVTRNGAVPAVTACSAGAELVQLDFRHSSDHRFDTKSIVRCTATNASDWAFAAQLYTGTYEVSVRREYGFAGSNLPDWTTKADSAFVVSAPRSSVVFDVPVPPQYTVSGRITAGGATPTTTMCAAGQSFTSIQFIGETDGRFAGYSNIRCTASNTADWTFSTSLAAGNYEVWISMFDERYADPNIAWKGIKARSGFNVPGPLTSVVIDVPAVPPPPLRAVSGRITLNGGTPGLTRCDYTNPVAQVTFDSELDRRYDAYLNVSCNGANGTTWTFSGMVAAGTYRVSVGPWTMYATTDLPPKTVVVPRLVVP